MLGAPAARDPRPQPCSYDPGVRAGAVVSDAASTRRHVLDLVAHLARRRLASQHRFTVLGWLWPLLRQLAQLAVLVFIFGQVFDIGIEDYATFVFTGLVLYNAFSTGVNEGTSSLLNDRHLVFTPRFPDIALPLVAAAVALVDLVLALPILLVLLLVEGRLAWTALLLPVLLLVHYGLTAGIAMAASAANVFVRDVGSAVSIGLALLFYMTPVFYGFKTVPEDLRWILQLNPMTAVLNAGRAVLFDGRLPAASDVLIAVGAAVVAMAVGLLTFRRLQRDFVDQL
jgi:lipopolysaccharide transport system permease protein